MNGARHRAGRKFRGSIDNEQTADRPARPAPFRPLWDDRLRRHCREPPGARGIRLRRGACRAAAQRGADRRDRHQSRPQAGRARPRFALVSRCRRPAGRSVDRRRRGRHQQPEPRPARRAGTGGRQGRHRREADRDDLARRARPRPPRRAPRPQSGGRPHDGAQCAQPKGRALLRRGAAWCRQDACFHMQFALVRAAKRASWRLRQPHRLGGPVATWPATAST